MKREIGCWYALCDPGSVIVTVKMDKEEFNRTVEGYKYLMEQRVLLGDDITCLTLVREILYEMEKGCQNDSRLV